MRIVSVFNQKGGSGKTTTAVNLSAILAEKGRKTLLVDLDPQFSASSWFGVREEGKGLFDVITNNGNLADIVVNTPVNVDLIPSSSWMIGAEKLLLTEVGSETLISRHLKQFPEDKWDYIVFDCPPSLGVLAVNALSASREILIPVEAHVMALSGLVQLLRTVDTVKERLNPDLSITGILACRVDARTRHSLEVVDQLRERFGDLVYNTVIRENVRIAECPSFSQPITSYAPRSRGAEDFRSFTEEFLDQES